MSGAADAARREPGVAAARPERWTLDAGDADVATLVIPPALARTRRFEIDVRFVVRPPADGAAAWHELAVELDGAREWSRRIETHAGSATDTLDYHCRRELPSGEALRIRATTKVQRALRWRLVIEAEEG